MWYIRANFNKISAITKSLLDGLEFKLLSNNNKFITIVLYDPRIKGPEPGNWDERKRMRSLGYVDPSYYNMTFDYAIVGLIMVSKMEAPYDMYYHSMATVAKNGYGPIMYDKAIEVVSNFGCKLVNHATAYYLREKDKTGIMTTPEASQVWNKYKDRKDVNNHDLGDGFFALSKDPNQKYFYE
jgi:hypothetical protein